MDRSQGAGDEVVFLGCGDVGPIHEPVADYSTFVRDILRTADIRFAQCERVYSERGNLQVHANPHGRLHPRMASVFSDCGFNVVSLASNHALDWGADGLLDTKSVLEGFGINVIGAGANIEEARRPAIFVVRDVRVGILAYCSVPKAGFVATATRPGVAPLRAATYYEPIDDQPGAPAIARTVVNRADIDAMRRDIESLRPHVDVIIVSCHWGVHHIAKVLADYETEAAGHAFDAGADMIIGHHAHVPKAIEVLKGKVCFHGLSNFIMTTSKEIARKSGAHETDDRGLQFGADGQRSLIAKAYMTSGGIQRVSFLPVQIDKDARPALLTADDPQFQEAYQYMEWVSDEVEHHFEINGNEVFVS